jgi:hypothetical protein
MLRPTVSQSVCLRIKHPSETYDQTAAEFNLRNSYSQKFGFLFVADDNDQSDAYGDAKAFQFQCGMLVFPSFRFVKSHVNCYPKLRGVSDSFTNTYHYKINDFFHSIFYVLTKSTSHSLRSK